MNSGDRAYRADGEIYVTGRVKDIIIQAAEIFIRTKSRTAARAEGVRKGCVVAFGQKDEASGTETLIVVAESREREASRRAAMSRRSRNKSGKGWDFRRTASN